MLHKSGVLNTTNRLILILLHSEALDDKSGPCFKCALKLYKENLLTTTPTDVFIFLSPEYLTNIASKAWIRDEHHVHVIPLTQSPGDWKLPSWLRPENVSCHIIHSSASWTLITMLSERLDGTRKFWFAISFDGSLAPHFYVSSRPRARISLHSAGEILGGLRVAVCLAQSIAGWYRYICSWPSTLQFNIFHG